MCNLRPDARHGAVFIFWHAHTTIFQHIYKYCVCYQNSIWLPFDSSNLSIVILSPFRDLINFFDWGFSWMMIAGDFIVWNWLRNWDSEMSPTPVSCDSSCRKPRLKSPSWSGRTTNHGSPVSTAVMGGLNLAIVLRQSNSFSKLRSYSACSA